MPAKYSSKSGVTPYCFPMIAQKACNTILNTILIYDGSPIGK